MNVLGRWSALWNRREGGESLALVRIFVGLVLLWDLGEVARFGLVETLWAPMEEGGLGPASHAEPVIAFYEWFGATSTTTWWLYGLACVAALCLSTGFYGGASALVLLFAYAQLEKLSPDADRGIDTLLRNALLVLMFARSDATLSVRAWLRDGRFVSARMIPAWPRYLLCAQLALLYFFAGALKQSANWSHEGGYAALFLVLQKPHLIRFELPHAWLVAAYPLLQAGAFVTVIWERAALALPLLLWLRGSAERGGRVRRFVNRARLLELWVATGVSFHLALAVLLALGIFPWGCLALYPALAAPHSWQRASVWLRNHAPSKRARCAPELSNPTRSTL